MIDFGEIGNMKVNNESIEKAYLYNQLIWGLAAIPSEDKPFLIGITNKINDGATPATMTGANIINNIEAGKMFWSDTMEYETEGLGVGVSFVLFAPKSWLTEKGVTDIDEYIQFYIQNDLVAGGFESTSVEDYTSANATHRGDIEIANIPYRYCRYINKANGFKWKTVIK